MKYTDNLQWRYATKIFDNSKKIEQDIIDEILEAANLTASSYGLQPFRIIHVKNEEIRKELVTHSWNQSQVADASDLLVIAIEKNIDEAFVDNFINNIVETRKIDANSLEGYKNMMMGITAFDEDTHNKWASNQAYIVLGNILSACAHYKVDSCPLEGIIKEKYDEILGLDKLNLSTVVACPIGFRSDKDTYQHYPKVRRPHEEFIVEI